MQPLDQNEIEKAALLFAKAFATDPAFAHCLQNEQQPQNLLRQFFAGYLHNCKDLLLYKTSENLEGVLCLYRWDKPPVEDFCCPAALETLEEFQILDRYYQRDFAVLDIMAVAPCHRGKGLAGRMIDFFVSYCKSHSLIALTEMFSQAHLQLYLAHGFAVQYQQTRHGITTYILEHPL